MPRIWLTAPMIVGAFVFSGFSVGFPRPAEAAVPRQPPVAPSKKIAEKPAAGKMKKKKSGGAKARAKAKCRGACPSPGEFAESRAAAVYASLLARPPRVPPASPAFIGTSSRKGPWLASVYSQGLVEASAQTEKLSDKLIMFRVLEQALGESARMYYPRTLGLKEFLGKHALVDARGRIKADGERIEQALYAEFPAGFVVRPAVGVAPRETRKGLYPEGDAFVAALVEGRFPGYEPRHFRTPVRSHILGGVASGEAVVLQDDVILRADAKKRLVSRTFREIRVHTYEGRVVPDSVPTRWVQAAKVEGEEIEAAAEFVASFLSAMPSRLLTRQAWGVDVAVFDNGEMVVTDIVTNRGRRIQWSSYLEQPRVLGAYSRHFEKEAGVWFGGVAGALVRNNFGNYFPYWDARIEKSRPGWRKLLSYLPPVP